MAKKVNELLEECKKLNKENKELQEQLRASRKTSDTIKTGNIDALVIAGKKEFKVYTEKSAKKTYRILIEKMHEGAVTLNEDGTVLYSNSYFANMVRLPLQKVIGAIFINFIDTSSKERFEILLKESKVNPVKEEVFIHTDNGKAIPVLMSVNQFLLDNNFVLSIIITDLTIQNKNKKELEHRTRELEKKNIEFKNLNKELALQNVEKEKRATDLIILSEDLKVQHEKLTRANEEILALNQNLEKRVLERTHELETVNYELKNLNLAKDKFLSVISHDLRNPFTALLMASDALSSDTKNHIFDNIRPFIKVINRTSHNIFQQLDELVKWAQMQWQNTVLNPEKIHLFLGAEQSLNLLRENALQKNIVFDNRIPQDIYVNADILMLRSIIQNLVTNSIKYSTKGGLITVNAQRMDKMIEVSVMDLGIGMEASISKNLFTNSLSTSAAGTDDEKGTGLGLMLVKDFVTQLGGTIRVESELGKKTAIIFTIPEYY